MTCINCSAEAEGKFCSNCSQPLHVKRLTFKEGFLDFWARIYGFDGMFPRTFRDLTIRPGFASREFINGNRAAYYGPVGYFFLLITCFLLLLSIIGLNYVEYLKAMQEALPVDKTNEPAMNNDVRAWVADNIKIVAFASIPLQAFLARYVLFRKQGLNFIEHSVLPLYAAGHWYWIQMVEAITFYYFNFALGVGLHGLLMSVYLGFGYTSFVPGQAKWKTFLKGVSIYWLSLFLFMIVVIIVMVLYFATHPDALDAIRPSRQGK